MLHQIIILDMTGRLMDNIADDTINIQLTEAEINLLSIVCYVYETETERDQGEKPWKVVAIREKLDAVVNNKREAQRKDYADAVSRAKELLKKYDK